MRSSKLRTAVKVCRQNYGKPFSNGSDRARQLTIGTLAEPDLASLLPKSLLNSTADERMLLKLLKEARCLGLRSPRLHPPERTSQPAPLPRLKRAGNSRQKQASENWKE